MKIAYTRINFKPATLAIIEQANSIITQYQAQGYDLTLRQLYYQFVARDLIANKQSEYDRLGGIISDARLAGLISWEAIVDRTRNLQGNSHFVNPAHVVRSCASWYQIDKWIEQKNRIEVWIEKDALAGVIEDVCRRNDVSYFSCRGYTSQSEMWSAGQRLQGYADEGQEPIVIHLGDHDPSGIDMTRDIEDRLDLFTSPGTVKVHRIALTMEQIKHYRPPPNPCKFTDCRAAGYVQRFGDKSWELDALEPQTLDALIEETILEYRDEKKWAKAVKQEKLDKKKLNGVADELENE